MAVLRRGLIAPRVAPVNLSDGRETLRTKTKLDPAPTFLTGSDGSQPSAVKLFAARGPRLNLQARQDYVFDTRSFPKSGKGRYGVSDRYLSPCLEPVSKTEKMSGLSSPYIPERSWTRVRSPSPWNGFNALTNIRDRNSSDSMIRIANQRSITLCIQ